ncbi:MAG TPA: hypothetical protein VKL61_01825, partial [Candidatus Polarisedimenticolia bacterium]|nr:hypothetical protein [Candidatus Polarisedimenticolia bacterium]
MKVLLILLLTGILGLVVAAAREKPGASAGPDDEARIFMNLFEAGMKNFYVGMNEEYWTFYTHGDPGKTELYEKIQSELLSDPKTFDRLKAWRGKIADPILARRVDLLYRTFALAQVTAQEKIYAPQN